MGSSGGQGAGSARVRRQPPAFRRVEVLQASPRTPRLMGITVGGNELDGLVIPDLAASVRLLLPPPGTQELVMPTWNGNEFLLPDGQRPILRTFTPRRLHTDTLELDLEIVVHGHGVAAQWATSTGPGAQLAVSGPGRGYQVDGSAFLLAGDETAIPAISQLLEAIPPESPVQAHIEIGDPSARLTLPPHPRATVAWYELPAGAPSGETLLTAIKGIEIDPGLRVWAAGEAAGMQRIRRHLFGERGVERARAVIRGYWKHGRTSDADDEPGAT